LIFSAFKAKQKTKQKDAEKFAVNTNLRLRDKIFPFLPLANRVKLAYNKYPWDGPMLFVIAVINYTRDDLCTKLTIWDQKF